MRHGASLLASMEGMSRHAFRIARELTNNSRSGLTVRFLSKKLEIPQEEIEYLLDINSRLIYTDITKIKLAPDGFHAIKRIIDGQDSHGDIASLQRQVKSMAAHDFRQFEERIGTEAPLSKIAAADIFIDKFYKHPDSIVTYVATRDFSETAREVFDIMWQSPKGIMSVSQIRAVHGGSDFNVEQALWELFQGFALFEMFRFDSEERLVRVAALLSEIRQYRKEQRNSESGFLQLEPLSIEVKQCDFMNLEFSEIICRLVASIAARPVRIRSDGDLFKEDQKRLLELFPDEAEPSLNSCLWVAESAGWLCRVDNLLQVGTLDELIKMDRLNRHRVLSKWFLSHGDAAMARGILVHHLDLLESESWYPVGSFVRYAMQQAKSDEQPILKPMGAHWTYLHPSASAQTHKLLTRMIEETLYWLGIVAHTRIDDDLYFQLTPLGKALITDNTNEILAQKYPSRLCEFVVQPNFDIVVPNDNNDPLLTVPLERFTTRSGSGLASIYKLSKEAFTLAVQEGHDAKAFIQFLLKHNRGGTLPSNVLMTLEDWQGGMKRVRLRTIHVLESDDPLVLADLMHRRRYEGYFSELDADAMLHFKGITKTNLVKALEKDGFVVD